MAAVTVNDDIHGSVLIKVDHGHIDISVTVGVSLEEVSLAITVCVYRPKIRLTIVVRVQGKDFVMPIAPGGDLLLSHARRSTP